MDYSVGSSDRPPCNFSHRTGCKFPHHQGHGSCREVLSQSHHFHHHHHFHVSPHCPMHSHLLYKNNHSPNCPLFITHPQALSSPNIPGLPLSQPAENASEVPLINDGNEEWEEEEEDPVFVLTDEWREFFAKSEAKRRSAKKLAKAKGKKTA